MEPLPPFSLKPHLTHEVFFCLKSNKPLSLFFCFWGLKRFKSSLALVMKILLLFTLLTITLNSTASNSAKTTIISKVDNSFFPDSKKDIASVLSNKVFKKYQDYNITRISQGEMRESIAYFVSLEKPFSESPLKLCFIFMSKKMHEWNQIGSVEKCKQDSICSCEQKIQFRN